MRLGIASWTVPWSIGLAGYPPPPRRMTAVGLVELAARLGVGILQIADNLPLHELSPAGIRELRSTAERRGITLETGTRGVAPEHLLRYLEISRQLGARILRTVSHTMESKPHINEVERWMALVLPSFEQAGVAIALENNESHHVDEFAWLMERLKSPSLGICMDTANSLGALEAYPKVVEGLARYTIVLHVKDFDILRIDTRMGFSVVGRPAGEGRVDFDWVFAQLAAHGRDPSVILEHWPPFTGTMEQTVRLEEEWLERSMRFLKTRATGSPARS
jgi:sugar phosphate isomerase/epimerase